MVIWMMRWWDVRFGDAVMVSNIVFMWTTVSVSSTHDVFDGDVKSCQSTVVMHGISLGGVKSCLILMGATHGVSSGDIRSCLLLFDRRQCYSGWKRGGM
jgi:hypothetical protein